MKTMSPTKPNIFTVLSGPTEKEFLNSCFRKATSHLIFDHMTHA